MRATVKDLRIHTKRLMEAVERGERVVITFRGKPRAQLVPIDPVGPGRLWDTELFGLWKDHDQSRNVAAYVDRQRDSRVR